LTVAGIAVILIPLIVAISGVMVWLRRRHLWRSFGVCWL
jgi:hypothetical protein